MIRCLSCGAETTNGLALCGLCQEFTSRCFVYLPIYFKNLARWRPGRAGSRPVPGSRVLYDGVLRGDGTGDRISDRLDEALMMATTRARELTKDRPHFPRPLTFTDAVLCDEVSQSVADDLNDDPARAMSALCQGFEEHLTSIATLDWCGDFVRDLGHHEVVLRNLTEELIPGWYAGACKRCEAATYVIPGLTWVTCPGCGVTTYAKDHLEVVLDEARGWVSTPRRIAGALVAMLDKETDVERLWERIRRWGRPEYVIKDKRTGEVKRVIPAGPLHEVCVRRLDQDGDEVGVRMFRLGDVLDQLQRETRALTRAG